MKRSSLRAVAAASLLALALAAPLGARRQARAVADVGMTVADLDRSVAFWTDVLEAELVSVDELAGDPWEHAKGVFGLRLRVALLRLGEELVELTDYLVPEGAPVPADSRSNDRWFQHVALVVPDVGAAYARLRAHGVRHASSGPQRLPDWNPNAGGIEAFYFLDPDGHVLEILSFPPGKGLERWHRAAARGDRTFLGIDHTALVVEDTERSFGFYRDLLGLQVVGGSLNHGTEQEHLNNVFGARLRITTLRAAEGPGVELLEYLAPAGGRPYPPDARPSDLVHWETRLVVDDVGALAARLHGAGAPFVSSGVVELDETGPRALLRDPDGHVVELSQPVPAVRPAPATAGR